MMKRSEMCVVGVLLCFLIASPQILAASSLKTFSSSVVCVSTRSFATAVEALNNMTFPAREYVTVKTFGNGTREATISVSITISQYCRVNVTMQAMLPTNSQETSTGTTASPEALMKRYINGNLPNYHNSSSDYMKFLSGGDYNDSMYVSYDHDDNYNVYYPHAWNKNYSLPDAEYPQPLAKQTHVHLPTWLVKDWYNGNMSMAAVEQYCLGLQSNFITAGGAVAGGLLGYLLSYFELVSLSSGAGALVGVVVGAIVGAIGAIITYWLGMQGLNQTQFVSDVVTEQCTGDGWEWNWGYGIVPGSTEAFIVQPPVWGIYDDNTLARVLSYHRVGVMVCEESEFYQSWGAQRGSPIHFTVYIEPEIWVNPGVFGLSPVCR